MAEQGERGPEGEGEPRTGKQPREVDVDTWNRDGLGREVYSIRCCYCGSGLSAPWVGAGVVRCGVCDKLLQIKRPDAVEACRHGRASHKRVGLGGYEDPSQCICERLFFWCPSSAAFYGAIALTSFIIGMGFYRVAPVLFPPPSTASGALLWGLSAYIALNTVCNFYWGASIDPGPPPLADGDSSGPQSTPNDVAGGGKEQWCEKCAQVKPRGTHHCRRCKRCVYRMDHHCVFLNNCVGAANLRFFLLFLFWVSLATFYVAVCCFITIQGMMVEAKAGRLVVLEELHTKGALPDVRRQLAQGQGVLALIVAVTMPIARVYGDTIGWDCILLFVVSGVTAVLVTMMLCYHLWLAWHGKTQMQVQFNLASEPTRHTHASTPATGLRGIRAALTPFDDGGGGVRTARTGEWLWLLGCFVPLPPHARTRKRSA